MSIGNDNIFTLPHSEAKDVHDAIRSGQPIQLSKATLKLVGDQVQILERHLSQLPKESSFDEVFTGFRGRNNHYMVDKLDITL